MRAARAAVLAAARTPRCSCTSRSRRSPPPSLPFPVMHVDTGHNFDEVIAYRDRQAAAAGARLVVASVQASIDAGRVMDPGEGSSRNRIQSTTLLDAINEHRFDAAFGGARRDEDKARAKERVLSFRDRFGRWDPRRQRPELWQLYQGKVNPGEHLRAFPLSDWTELDIWQYVERERIELPSIYFAHERDVVLRDGMLLAVSRWVAPDAATRSRSARTVRYRTVGDATCTGAVASEATTVADDHRGDRDRPDLRARRDPRRRPVQRDRHGGPQARGLLLGWPPSRRSWTCCASRPSAPSTTASRPSSAGSSSTRASCSTTSSRPSRTRRSAAGVGDLDLSLRHRRPARGARAGHHDRRRLPLRRDADAQVHHRGLPRARAVHAQHGDRRVDRGPRPRRRRRDRGAEGADAPAPVHRRAARRAPRRRRGQQDGPRRVGEGPLRRARGRRRRARRAARHRDAARGPGLGAERRQRRRALRGRALVRRADGARARSRPRPRAGGPARARSARGSRSSGCCGTRPGRRTYAGHGRRRAALPRRRGRTCFPRASTTTIRRVATADGDLAVAPRRTLRRRGPRRRHAARAAATSSRPRRSPRSPTTSPRRCAGSATSRSTAGPALPGEAHDALDARVRRARRASAST